MVKYPEPIALPVGVLEKRKERLRHLVRSCTWGMSARLSIVLLELLGVILYGSHALLLDAIASLADVFSTLFFIISLRLAAKPPDTNHPFGHGRVEPLVGLQLGLFTSIIGAGLLVQQGISLMHPEPGEVIDGHAWIIPVIAMVLLEAGYQIVSRAAKVQHSPALASDAIHYRIDSLTSLFAAVALGFGAFVPEWSASFDHLGAIVIALFMAVLGINASRKNLHQLMDRKPEERFFGKVDGAARLVEGVLGTEKIRIQQYGPDAHVDIDIEVDPRLSVDDAHRISQKVRSEIQKAWPSVRDVTVHVEPFYPGDH